MRLLKVSWNFVQECKPLGGYKVFWEVLDLDSISKRRSVERCANEGRRQDSLKWHRGAANVSIAPLAGSIGCVVTAIWPPRAPRHRTASPSETVFDPRPELIP